MNGSLTSQPPGFTSPAVPQRARSEARLLALRELMELEEALRRLTVRARLASQAVREAELPANPHLAIEGVEKQLREMTGWVCDERDGMIKAAAKALREPRP